MDEFQDTSEAQSGLLRLLTSGWQEGDGRTLFAVGDPMQSIYRFRDAEVRLFLTAMETGRVGEVPVQFIDLTRRRVSSFFGEGIVAHVGMADPVCPDLADAMEKAIAGTGATVHRGGTYVCIEGPQFSTKAESNVYRAWGVDVIGMTNATEAKLAREAELCYATLALVTDYDVWHETAGPVNVEEVIQNLVKNTATAKDVLRHHVLLSFEELRLHRIQVAIIPRNVASRRVVEKLRLRNEGVAERYLEINGVWEDHVRYAITAEEWEERGEELLAEWVD